VSSSVASLEVAYIEKTLLDSMNLYLRNKTNKQSFATCFCAWAFLLWKTFLFQTVSCHPPSSGSLTGQVTVLDQETVAVNWTVHHDQQVLGLEIVYSPVRSSYYIVLPITNPATETAMLENLLHFTSYQVVIRTNNNTKFFIQSNTIYFSTSVITSFSRGSLLGGQDFKNDEVLLVFFILFLWGVVLSIFFQRWGKIRSLLPYQPVYSKEMAVKIEQIETEKKIRSNRTSFSFYPVDCDCSVKHEMNSLGKTSSTLLLKQPNSLDVDGDQLRKTKSAENICCPQIIIDQTFSYPTTRLSISSSSNHLNIPTTRSASLKYHRDEQAERPTFSENCRRSLPSKALSQTCKGVEPQQRKEKRLVKQREVSEYFCDNGKASGIFY